MNQPDWADELIAGWRAFWWELWPGQDKAWTYHYLGFGLAVVSFFVLMNVIAAIFRGF